ncbi:hypothetical protein CWE04_11980 [Thomasclavelia cocleata]|uniref:Bacteriophage holin of superfamily 6 (Holin_LLH) n=1 Tax=Thomasclavelia cocleata TaxID=69824 RepID=A0A1I0BMI2_9FIRM|nr:hypothetical protein [Thomasclavelia cocleata]MCR1960181.1 hypothetical protein [Thomasclavelia cocleata]NDO41845.1 hypothetical protein [Thomasclavelia cocleata]PJN79921.1 hypothetical protein CWE04_11980 [Thomasclavelia cocleata]SET08067.1 hypothetical protein SAMN04489758_101185 [Thomasclavelia cocleata]
MNLEIIYSILTTIATLITGGLAIYLETSKKAQEKAKEIQEVIAELTAKTVIYIKEAEENYKDTTKMGGKKFNEVVDKLYALVPTAIKTIITKSMIEEIVQSTFEEIEEYVQLQLDNAIDFDKIENK